VDDCIVCLFLYTIVLSVLLRFTAADYQIKQLALRQITLTNFIAQGFIDIGGENKTHKHDVVCM
jgi:hypothetical protein